MILENIFYALFNFELLILKSIKVRTDSHLPLPGIYFGPKIVACMEIETEFNRFSLFQSIY